MRNNKFHKNRLHSLMHDCIQNSTSENHACFKCGEQAHKNNEYRDKLQQKMKSARNFFLYLRRNHQNDHNCSKMQVVFLSKLIRQEQQQLRRKCKKLLQQKNRVDAIQLHLDEFQFQFYLKTLKWQQDAR